MKRPLRMLLVHDSATVRAALRHAVTAEEGEFVIVGEGTDGDQAAALTERTRPDVILMDVVMPRMSGYEATRAVMAAHPTPIVLISSVVSTKDVSVALAALRSGALAISEQLPSPSDPTFAAKRAALVQLLRAMANVDLGRSRTARHGVALARPNRSVAAIGVVASTGGPQVLDEIFRALPATFRPILVVQHIASGFTEGFAQWLGQTTKQRVVVAQDGQPAEASTIYIAPEQQQLGIDATLRLTVRADAPVGVFRPSGSYLFSSMARALGASAAGVILTGMGSDGAAGLSELRAAGGDTVAQDAATCVIFGMPKAAIDLGAACEVLPFGVIAAWIGDRSQR